MRRRRAVRCRFNPYIAGTPVFDRHLFFGREQLALRTLRLLGSHSVKLTGERRIGKTTFLYYLQRLLAAENGGERRFFPVFVDLEAVTAPGLFHALMEETVEALALAPRTLAELRFTGEHNGYQASDFGHDLQRVVEELSCRTQRQVRLVLLIDEVDALREDPEAMGDQWLGPLLEDCSQELRVVLAGVGRGASGSGETHRRHGTLDELELEPFTPEEAEALVKRPVAGVFRYEPGAVERILQLSRRRPYLIQRLCLHAVNRMLDEGRTTVRPADVEAASCIEPGCPGVQCE
jgi:predicted AAA+ superfamily ATPase